MKSRGGKETDPKKKKKSGAGKKRKSRLITSLLLRGASNIVQKGLKKRHTDTTKQRRGKTDKRGLLLLLIGPSSKSIRERNSKNFLPEEEKIWQRRKKGESTARGRRCLWDSLTKLVFSRYSLKIGAQKERESQMEGGQACNCYELHHLRKREEMAL